jgi:hypothetical protein
MEQCSQVGAIADLTSKVLSLDKDINGNGRKGMKEIVFRMDETLTSVVRTIDRIEKNQVDTKEIFEKKLAVLENVQTIKTVEDATREKLAYQRQIHNRWLIGIVVTLAIFVTGLLISNREKNTKLKEIQKTTIEQPKPTSQNNVI